MNHIFNNPFRILGLPITASEREIAKQINTLATFAEMGKVKLFDTDFPFLPSADRTPDAIEEAKKQIEQSESKLLYSLFWFWKNNSTDELAFEVLYEGNTDKAISIWEKSALSNKHKIFKAVVLFENLIRQSTSWSELDNEDHLLHKDADEYIVERKKDTSSSVPCVNIEFSYEGNWTIDCDTQWIRGTDNIGYGIIFGREKGNYFTFDISGNGYYCFGKTIEWDYTKLIPWKKNDVINSWSSNHLQIKKINNGLTFYINNVLVDSFQSESFFGKSLGFSVKNNQRIVFRNFKLCKLIEDETYGEGLNITSKNFSNIKNLSTLFLGLSLASTNGTFKLNHFRKGIVLSKNIFTNENMAEYSKLIAGDRYNYNPEKTLHFYINDIIDSVKLFLDKTDGISTSELVNSFATFPVEAKQFLNNKFVAKQIHNIEKEIELSQSLRKVSVNLATDAGKILVRHTKADLDYLRETLGEGEYQYQTITEKLSLEIVQCGIDAFNFFKTPSGEIDYANAIRSEVGYLHEYEYALSIAVTQRAKDRAKENLDSCKQYIANKDYYNCWFCESNPPEESSNFKITIYKENSRSYFPSSVQFSYIPISIPRCVECKQKHLSRTNSETYLILLSVCTIIGTIIAGSIDDAFWLLGAFLGFIVGLIISNQLTNSQRDPKNIKKTNKSTIAEFPAIREKLQKGWQFSKPSA